MNTSETKKEKKFSQVIGDFINEIKDLINDKEVYVREVETRQQGTWDYIHKLTLESQSDEEILAVSKRLIDVCQDRNYYRDRISIAQTAEDFIFGSGTRVVKDLEILMNIIQREENRLDNRSYWPKSMTIEEYKQLGKQIIQEPIEEPIQEPVNKDVELINKIVPGASIPKDSSLSEILCSDITVDDEPYPSDEIIDLSTMRVIHRNTRKAQ